MISSKERGKKHSEEQSQRSAMIRALKQLEAGRKEVVAREAGVEAHALRLEGEVRRDGIQRGRNLFRLNVAKKNVRKQ